jgi:hypothetical protein
VKRTWLTTLIMLLFSVSSAVWMTGCVAPSQKVSRLRLGDTPDDVLQKMGKPFAVRAAKVYEDTETSEVWEYIAPVFSLGFFSDDYDKTFWVMFENGKVVQWGVPGDFSGSDSISGEVPVKDYFNKKILR